MEIRANGIDIEVEDTDSGSDQSPGAAGSVRPTVLLIMGLGIQLIAWPPQWVQALADHYVRLFQVIGSPAFATPEPELRDRILLGVERGFYREGTLWQMLGIMADTADVVVGGRRDNDKSPAVPRVS